MRPVLLMAAASEDLEAARDFYNEGEPGLGEYCVDSLLTEMEEFENRTPADLISKGETGRLWASLFYLRSGMPD